MPAKRSRSPSPPPSKSEESAFTFPKLEAPSGFRDHDVSPIAASASDMVEVVSASAAAPANTSLVKESLEDNDFDEPSSIEISAAPSSESTFEIELADGTKTVVKFNSRDRIRDIHDYIDSSRLGERKDYKLLTQGSPQRELTDMDQTIEEAGIISSRLIQEYRDSSSSAVCESSLAGADSPIIGLIQDPSARAITLTVLLRDGTELEMSFTYDKTVRDIHERIDVIRPNDNRAYHFLDSEAKELRDLDQDIEGAALTEPRLVQMDD